MADEVQQKKSGGGRLAFLFAAIVFGLFIALFFKNETPVEVDLLFKKIPLNVNLLITICFGLGLLFGIFLMIPSLYRGFFARRKLNKELKVVTKESLAKDELISNNNNDTFIS